MQVEGPCAPLLFFFMKESKLQRKIKKALVKRFGGMWFKIHGSRYQKVGLPDLWGLVDGLTICIEVKLPKKKHTLSAVQKKCIRQINRNGGYAFVSTNVSHAMMVVRQILKANGKATKKPSLLVSKRRGKGWSGPGLRRIIYASGNWKNDNRIKNIIDKMEKKTA